MKNTYLSVIIPFFNEQENLKTLHTELTGVLRELSIETEIVYINDGSSDNSLEILSELVNKDHKGINIRIINFSTNFGQTAAIKAGIDNSRGTIISILDSDLQNDPRDIPRFLQKLEEGYDAVFGWRKLRRDATLRSLFSKWANKLINKVFSYPFHDVGCSARVVKKKYLVNLQLYGELHRIMPVLIYLKGAKIAEIEVKHRRRIAGKSKYGFERIVKTLIDIITVKFLNSFGTRPAYVFGSMGFVSGIFGLISFFVVAYKKIFFGVFVHKEPLFVVAIFLIFLGVQFVLMGLLAELLVRTYFETQKKAIYDIKDIKDY